MALSRRQFLQATGALALLFPLLPGAKAAFLSKGFTPPAGIEELNDWIWIGQNNKIVIGVSQCEVGQGIFTGLAEVVAAEMDADWSQVDVMFVSNREAYRQEAGGEAKAQFVAASTSMTNFYQRTRLAGAQARAFFLAAGAREFGTTPENCYTENSFVTDRQTGRKAAYSSLIHWAEVIPLDAEPSLKSTEQEKNSIIGRTIPRIDTPQKVDGSAQFGIDVDIPDMLIGVPWMVPSLNGKVISVLNEKSVRELPGVVDIVLTRHWSTFNIVKLDPDLSPNTVIVVAKSYWQAKKAVDLLKVDFQYSEKDNFSTRTIDADNQRALQSGDLIVATDRGDAPGIIEAARGSGRFHEASYKAPYITHATMEPCNATCFVEGDRVTAWGPFQGWDLTRNTLAKLCGIPVENVTVHTTFLGGSFGRKYLPDAAMHAAMASKVVGKPVKVIYPREVDIQHAYYRPGNTSIFRALLGEDGYPVALWARYAGQGLFWQVHRHRVEVGGGWDETIVECMYNTVYDVPALRVEAGIVEQNISLSFLRGVGSVASVFFLESFISELSYKAGIDEYVYRQKLLKNAPELKRVMDETARYAEWDKPLPPGFHRGMAIHVWVARDDAFISYITLVAEVQVTGSEWRVSRMVCGIDCGKVINPGLIRANIEGGIGFALSGALHSALHFEQGAVMESNFNDYGILKLEEMPEIEVLILESNRPPQGCGEVSTAVVAPAIASALLKATGKPWREHPFPKRLEIVES